MNTVLKEINRQLVVPTIAPLLFIFMAVFVFPYNIGAFYALIATLVIVMVLLHRKLQFKPVQLLAYILLTGAAIGISSSVILITEEIESLKNPEYVTSCSISPVVACSPIIASEEAEVFTKIPNPVFGLVGFACFLTAGMGVITGAKYNRMFWLTLLAGTMFGSLFSIYLIHGSLYTIGALCLYCMSVWFVMFTLFWSTLSYVLHMKYLVLPDKVSAVITKNIAGLITSSIGIVILLIFFRWSDYWTSLL